MQGNPWEWGSNAHLDPTGLGDPGVGIPGKRLSEADSAEVTYPDLALAFPAPSPPLCTALRTLCTALSSGLPGRFASQDRLL